MTLEAEVELPNVARIRLSLEDFLRIRDSDVALVFFEIGVLDELAFEYELPDHRSSLQRVRGEPFEVVAVDLFDLAPDLERFREYFGQATFVTFYAPYGGVLLSCTVVEDWYLECLEQLELAEAAAREKAQQEREQQAQDEAAVLERHTQKLRLLLDDTAFLRLAKVKSTTQRTLLNYAKQKEPDAVTVLGEQRMKELMGELRDWVLVNHPS